MIHSKNLNDSRKTPLLLVTPLLFLTSSAVCKQNETMPWRKELNFSIIPLAA
jgi:hypothetical protein